ncbi:MAG: threonine synthase [Thermodesulfobacteriota bacterium]
MPDQDVFPTYRGEMQYVCQGCGAVFSGQELHYACPDCSAVFLLQDLRFAELMQTSPEKWRQTFQTRAMSTLPCLQGIFRFYELISPILEAEDIVYLGEGQTPVIWANQELQRQVGQRFAFKNEGQNPSASFKDRGMACAFSYLRYLVRKNDWSQVLTVCASTGDTSASAAMYAAYVGGAIKSVVLLPQGKVTPQQLGQPLGSGALVLELPGVFDDCMQVVQHLAEHYRVALLNSKNSWRILGQESYAFELAQHFAWDLQGKAVFVPIGNAGNISAIMAGFLKLFRLGLITALPRIFGVQSEHADPVFKYYSQPGQDREYRPVRVKSSVAQAAMIGNPVSFPRVQALAREYERLAGRGAFQVLQVQEQMIMDSMLMANSNGHIACTQGGECLAGLRRARELQLLDSQEEAVLNSTAHSLKFQGFQEMYFQDSFPAEYNVQPRRELINQPEPILDQDQRQSLSSEEFISQAAKEIVDKLGLEMT